MSSWDPHPPRSTQMLSLKGVGGGVRVPGGVGGRLMTFPFSTGIEHITPRAVFQAPDDMNMMKTRIFPSFMQIDDMFLSFSDIPFR